VRAAVLGSSGQLGRALSARFHGAALLDFADLDIADAGVTSSFSWWGFDLVINAAYTAVDKSGDARGTRRRLVGQRHWRGEPGEGGT
jgi:dTDP-4-dehydrorhamnose reductase